MPVGFAYVVASIFVSTKQHAGLLHSEGFGDIVMTTKERTANEDVCISTNLWSRSLEAESPHATPGAQDLPAPRTNAPLNRTLISRVPRRSGVTTEAKKVSTYISSCSILCIHSGSSPRLLTPSSIFTAVASARTLPRLLRMLFRIRARHDLPIWFFPNTNGPIRFRRFAHDRIASQ